MHMLFAFGDIYCKQKCVDLYILSRIFVDRKIACDFLCFWTYSSFLIGEFAWQWGDSRQGRCIHIKIHGQFLCPRVYTRQKIRSFHKYTNWSHKRRWNRFRTGFLAQCRRDLSFPDCILWTDEATITPNGVSNSHNFLYWRGENRHVVHEDALQYGRWSINVWAGIVANQVVSVICVN